MRIYIFFVGLLVCFTLKAQRIGVKAGITQSWLRGKALDSDTYQRRNGGYVGMYLDIVVNKTRTIILQPEVIFTSEGGEILKETTENSLSQTIEVFSNVLRFPILVKISPFPKWTIEAGPQLTHRFWGGIVRTGVVKNNSLHKVFDFGLDIGATYYFSTPIKESFFLQARWTNNFLEMLVSNKVSTHIPLSENNILRSSIGQIGVGYKF